MPLVTTTINVEVQVFPRGALDGQAWLKVSKTKQNPPSDYMSQFLSTFSYTAYKKLGMTYVIEGIFRS